MTPLELLARHELHQLAFERTKDKMVAAARRVVGAEADRDKIRRKNWNSLSPAAKYDHAVMRGLQAVYSTFTRIEDAQALLRVYPTSIGKGRVRQSRADWVRYHFGYLTVSLATVVDVSLKLVARVHQLGLADRHCTLAVVTTHEWVSASLRKHIWALDKCLGPHKARRNRYLHAGDGADPGELVEPELFSDLSGLSLIALVDPTSVPKTVLKDAWRAALRQLEPPLKEAADTAAAAVIPILDDLLPEYRARSDLLAGIGTARTPRSKP